MLLLPRRWYEFSRRKRTRTQETVDTEAEKLSAKGPPSVRMTTVPEYTSRYMPNASQRNEQHSVPQANQATYLPQGPAGMVTGQGTNATQGDFDEYGTELGPDARVWKTYVKEADRFDAEKVEEWNKSLDVILIFAALFSAVSTAFVIESSKKLREDPSDASAHTLQVISQTLLIIANNSQNLAAASPAVPTDGFTPSRSDVYVNILWFLSLSISVAVSLIAMLAKEWCYIFMSNRTGHPCSQAKRRQKRWDALKKWMMPEVLMFLPSLIHLALLLFAAGLCVYLWEMHFGVALPVVMVTLIAFGVYTASTILPLVYELCPYSTTASRFIETFRNTLVAKPEGGGHSVNTSAQDLITSRALRWLIEECEDPRSVDTALQAIAGAENLPLQPLEDCDAVGMVCQRMIAGSNYSGNYDVVFKLYARAFAVLQPSNELNMHEQREYSDLNELLRKIRHLQIDTEKTVANLLRSKKLIPTQANLSALRTGNNAALYSLESLVMNYGSPDQALGYIDSAVVLLEEYWKDQRILHPAALQSLAIGTAVLLSCSAVYPNAATIVPYLVRLLKACPNPGDQLLGIILMVFSLSRNDYPGWTHPSPLGNTGRVERAIEVLTHYAPELNNLHQIAPGTLNNFGLLELLFNVQDYRLLDRNLGTIYNTLKPTWVHDVHVIHTFPMPFDQRQYVKELVTKKLSLLRSQGLVHAPEALIEAYLLALSFTYSLWVDDLTPEVYAFVVESICQISTAKSRVLPVGNELATKISSLHLSAELAKLFRDRDLVSLLANALDSSSYQTRQFAAMQLHRILGLIQEKGDELELGTSWASLLTNMFRCEEFCNPLQRLELIREALADELARMNEETTNEKRARNINKLRIKLRALQATTARIIFRSFTVEEQLPSHVNKLALSIGQSAIPLCLQSSSPASRKQIRTTLHYAVKLLEICYEGRYHLGGMAFQSLIIGTATLLACSGIYLDAPTTSIYVVRLLHAEMQKQYLGIMLAAFALAQGNDSELTSLAPLDDIERAERAVQFITHYFFALEQSGRIPHKPMKNFGIFHLLSNSSEYGLKKEDYMVIYTEFTSIRDTRINGLHTFPQAFDFGSYVMGTVTRKLSDPKELDAIFSNQASIQAHLDVLRCTYSQGLGPPTPYIYAFALESLCRASTLWAEIIGEQLAIEFPPPQLSDRLAEYMASRNIITLLVKALESPSRRVRIFATAQLGLLVELLLRARGKLGNSWVSILVYLFRYKDACNPLQQLRMLKGVLANRLIKMRSKHSQYLSTRIYPLEYLEEHLKDQLTTNASELPVGEHPYPDFTGPSGRSVPPPSPEDVSLSPDRSTNSLLQPSLHSLSIPTRARGSNSLLVAFLASPDNLVDPLTQSPTVEPIR